MKNSKFTIITICRNEEKNIENTILSVLNQTNKDFEYIVVDGNSTDNTLDVVNKYKDKIDKIISENDKGIYDAMNKGILASSGKYLIFMNAGDYFTKNNILEKVSDVINQYPDVELIYGNTEVWHNGVLMERRNVSTYTSVYCSAEEGTLQHQATFYDRELFKKYGLYNTKYRIVADSAFTTKCLLHNIKVYFINDALAVNIPYGLAYSSRKVARIERRDRVYGLFPFYGRLYVIIKFMKVLTPELYRKFGKKISDYVKKTHPLNYVNKQV